MNTFSYNVMKWKSNASNNLGKQWRVSYSHDIIW